VVGAFLITGEGSVAAGIRRIEAVTGRAALDLIHTRLDALQGAADFLDTTPEQVPERAAALLQQVDESRLRLGQLQRRLARQAYDQLSPRQVGGVVALAGIIPDATAETLRELTDLFRSQHPSGAILLGSLEGGRPLLVAAVDDRLVERGIDAAQWVRAAAKVIGGGGGGKSTLAQAGGKDPEGLEAALTTAINWLEERLT
jgi:alanyl-tRNA synthetase